MKEITRNLLLAAFLAASTAIGSHAHAQASLTFSGGNGTTMEMILTNKVKYTVTTYTPAGSLYFDFQNLGIYSFSTDSAFTGTIKYSINGGAMVALDSARSGYAEGSVAAADGYLEGGVPGNSPALPVGTVITLIPGRLLSSGPEDNAPPKPAVATRRFCSTGKG